MQVTSGNAAENGCDFGFWFLGDVRRWAGVQASKSDFGLRQSSVVEMKWGVHRKGETRADWSACSEMRTISLLISGKFRLQFRSPLALETVMGRLLTKPGDYAIWGTDLEHAWTVEEDAVILTVRWRETGAAGFPNATPATPTD